MAHEKRLIDADKLMEQFSECNFKGTVLKKLIEAQPTVDAVEVVRCEKCLFRSQYPDENGCYKCGGLQTEDEELVMMVKPDFFCAYGERRGENAAD